MNALMMNLSRMIVVGMTATLLQATAATYYWAPGGTLGGDGNWNSTNWTENADGSGPYVMFASDNATLLTLNGVPGTVTYSAWSRFGTATFETTGYTINPPFNLNTGGPETLQLNDNVTLNLFSPGTSGSLHYLRNITGGTNAGLVMQMGSSNLTKSIGTYKTVSTPLSQCH